MPSRVLGHGPLCPSGCGRGGASGPSLGSIGKDRGVVHHETFGRGKPMVLLRRWLGSCTYWLSTIESLAKHGHKAYALDFWSLGASAKWAANGSPGRFTRSRVC